MSNEEWYQVESQLLEPKLREQFSLFSLVKETYPTHDWKMWRFRSSPRSTFYHKENVDEFINFATSKLGITELKDWYHVTTENITQLNGNGLIRRYKNMLNLCLNVFPHHDWKPWKFKQTPMGYWDTMNDKAEYFKWLENELGIRNMEDWYRISLKHIQSVSNTLLFEKQGGIHRVLRKHYPEIKWDVDKLRSQKSQKSSQWRLLRAVETIFPTANVIEDYKTLNANENKSTLELDVYIDQFSIGFEYQGQHHFRETFVFGKKKDTENRDKFKLGVCKSIGITLIQVPFWWDYSVHSLVGTILCHRPDLAKETKIVPGQPIPKELSADIRLYE
eukprot:TRINITY_DN5417_c0_g1_i1.p1 TRINITY_DN5417_c0_g1~~TRINITY_DN5417_c0_g1_i1.p1  ORF type:complete len:333 (+),score=55.76 TRINITY_DN5417_c0_g1_i1:286-1284(+)